MSEQGPEKSSLATHQRPVSDPSIEHPLWPPITTGCPESSTEDLAQPLEVGFDYGAVDPALFDRPIEPGAERWAPLLPPLVDGAGLGEGGTPTIPAPGLGFDGDVHVKDESRNPTWSHKDRLNRCVVDAAVRAGASGVAVSSSGNHGASAAAYAARAGLPCVVLTSPETPGAVQRFIASYGAAVLAVPGWEDRRRAVDRLAAEHGYHPASSRTAVHTGHPYGPEGYKPIAYELHRQLGGRVPGSVFVPTGHAELLYGAWKGFRELRDLGVVDRAPAMVACEPAVRAPLAAAMDRDEAVAEVAPEPTAADAIKATRSSVRGRRALEESDGYASPFTEPQLEAAQDRLARIGLWQEASGAAGVAGLAAAVATDRPIEGPVVCLATSSGFKDGARWEAPGAAGGWDAIREALDSEYDVPL